MKDTRFGQPAGLRGRMREWRDAIARNRAMPWFGTGLIHDMECVMRLLDLREFAEWLRTKGDPEHAEFAASILADQDTLEAVTDALHVAGRREPDPVRGVELLHEEAQGIDGIRAVLVELGALDASDTTTPLPDLLRMLLS